MKKLWLSACVAFLASAASALAEPYWYAYEGDALPESEGWYHETKGTPAQRWLEDGALAIDSRGDYSTTDSYSLFFDNCLDPGENETFVMSCRLKPTSVTGFCDPGVIIKSDEFYAVGLIFNAGIVRSLYEANMSVTYEPGVYHEFTLTSTDMRNYELFVDGQSALSGVLLDVLGPAQVTWGDLTQGGESLTYWDYVRFGVVPEPSAVWLLFSVALLTFSLGRRGGMLSRYAA